MKQILVISGKGGTGKTVITSAFAALAENAVMADCDVDAADLHLLLEPTIGETHMFKSGVTASIDKDQCQQCGRCIEVCRFSGITSDYVVDPVSCEGCGFCSLVCSPSAISLKENETGTWFVSETRFGPMVHARLGIAEENSGKLVTLVRQKAKEIADEKGAAWIIIDGSPGIGCPVIASLSGVDCAVIVTEPTLSGLHDMDRVVRVAKHFNVPVLLIINKYDLNEDMSSKIVSYAVEHDIRLLGKIKFDAEVVHALTKGQTIIEYSNNGVSETIKKIWEKLCSYVDVSTQG